MPTPERGTDMTLERYVDELRWPANQDELVTQLRRLGAPDPIVRRVMELPQHEFDDADELRRAFRDGETWREGATPDRT